MMKKIICSIVILLCLLPIFALAEKTVTLSFVGDCTLGGEERTRKQDSSFDAYLERNGYAYFFEKVQSVIENDDVTVANLEGVLSDSQSGRVEKTYNFRGPSHFVNVLAQSSVEAVNIANNHIFDYGARGMHQTVSTLDEAGQNWFGLTTESAKTWVYEKDGIRIGFLGYELSLWGFQDRQLVKDSFEKLRTEENCQVVVAVMHGGAEYNDFRTSAQQSCANAALRFGADLVIGHHPHVLQGIEVKDGKTVCYSLGNFVFGGNNKVRAPYTAIFQFTLSFDDENNYLGHQLNIIPALPSGDRENNNYQPVLATGGDAHAAIAQIQIDTAFRLNPYIEGVGAVQDFVPVNKSNGGDEE